jgi:hypothetical protein
MKFNLKTFAEKTQEGDIHYEMKLQREHQKAPESITQKQLEKDRVPEKEVIVEKLLEQKRLGGSSKIIEKNLNDSTSGLHKHRNAKAHAGDINKIEEQRLSKAKQEDEKYETASGTPKKKKWWEHLKAESKNRIVTAQELAFDESDRWDRIDDTWMDEEGVMVENEPSLPDEDTFIEELGSAPLKVDEIRPIDTPLAQGVYIVLDITPEGSQLGLNELQQAAYELVLREGYDYLADIEDFTPETFFSQGDQIVARLIGSEYLPSVNKLDGGENFNDENPFKVSDIQETEAEGVVLGTVSVEPEMMELLEDMSDEELKRQVLDAIGDAHPEINVEDDGIDLDKLMSGKINFVGQVSVPKKGRPESWENVKGEPIASSDFKITVLSGTKKK